MKNICFLGGPFVLSVITKRRWQYQLSQGSALTVILECFSELEQRLADIRSRYEIVDEDQDSDMDLDLDIDLDYQDDCSYTLVVASM